MISVIPLRHLAGQEKRKDGNLVPPQRDSNLTHSWTEARTEQKKVHPLGVKPNRKQAN